MSSHWCHSLRGMGTRFLAVFAVMALASCSAGVPSPMAGLDRQVNQAGSSRSPALAGRWLAFIATRGGREQVVLVDVERQAPVPLTGLNRPDAQPLTVSVDQGGNRLAVVRRIGGRTELVLYRRNLSSLEPIVMAPAGVPGLAALSADGRELAVQVSRGGLWQVDLIRLP